MGRCTRRAQCTVQLPTTAHALCTAGSTHLQLRVALIQDHIVRIQVALELQQGLERGGLQGEQQAAHQFDSYSFPRPCFTAPHTCSQRPALEG